MPQRISNKTLSDIQTFNLRNECLITLIYDRIDTTQLSIMLYVHARTHLRCIKSSDDKSRVISRLNFITSLPRYIIMQ